jgi:hypothetical protein
LDGENSETIVPLPVMIHQVRYVACEKSDSDVIDIVSERRGECDRRGDTVAHSEGRNARRGRGVSKFREVVTSADAETGSA